MNHVKTQEIESSTTCRLALIAAAATMAATGWMCSLPTESEPVVQAGRQIFDRTPPVTLAGFRSDVWFLPDDELLGFVEIPAGPFLMGSDPAIDPLAFENERWSVTRAQGMVDVPTFYIGRYEVTVAQFQAFVEATGFAVTDQTLQGPLDHPVSSVSWPDALAYCRWLEDTLQAWPETPPLLDRLLRGGWQVSLPSEAEWEKAARGTDGRIYPWGNEPRPDRANFGRRATTSAGHFDCPECPFGLFDMAGNVWELTRSPYASYPYDPGNNRNNLDVEALWVIRGGHFGDREQFVRAGIRTAADPGARRPFIGFRVVISQF